MRATHALLTIVGSAALLTATAACGDDTPGAGAASPPAAADPTATALRGGDGPSTTAPATSPAPPARGAVRTVATDLAAPWDIEFLPNRDALVTERDSAKLLRITPGRAAQTVMTIPGVVPGGEGGLLGLAVSPRFSEDETVYVYFTAASDNRVAKVDLGTKKVTPILTGLKKGPIHDGGALELGPDGHLYVGVGDTGDTSNAQSRASRNGKILRITVAGKVPRGNPFKGSPIWSLGHRNVQGLAFDRSGRLWASEFGQDTTDEVNLIRPGRNYGWPVVEGKGSTQGGRFTNPLVTWSPTSSSSPSGAAITGRELYVSALAGRKLWRIKLSGASAGRPQALFSGRYGRIRAVAQAPDGSIWFATSNRDGRGDPRDGDDRILQLGT
ncbi:MAG: PQQ-dependent sugar dehydrogenase [Patulibacter minatonensis]